MVTPTSHRRGEHVRQTVLAAAFDELVANGFDGATVAGVAKRSGVHETTVYRRWTTRENLLVAALLERSADAIPAPDTGSIRDDLLAILREVLAYVGSPAGTAILRAAMLPVDDTYTEARKGFWAQRIDALTPVVARGVERGELRTGTDGRLLLEMLVAPIHGRLLLTGEPVGDELAERLVDLALNRAASRELWDVIPGSAALPYAERVPNTYRVVQWNTGNVGKSSLKSIADNPLLELVGCFAWSPEKAGRDAGELVGIAPLGVAATNDIDALLALKPDCVVYNPMWINVDELVRILSAGVNVVTTASFITGRNLGDGRDRILEACEKGGSTMFGSGVSPGFAELLAIVSAMVCNRVDKVTVNEAADTTFYDSPETEKPVGFGQPIDHPDLQAMAAKGTAIFGEAVALVGDALGIELDDIRCEAEFAQTTADLEMASWTITAGCVAGVYISWQGILDGTTVIDLNVRWRKGQTLEPDWKIDQDGWVIQVDGQPSVTTKVGFLPPPYFQAETIEEFMALGHIMTAMPAINAIPAVVAAAPGIATYADLPLTLPRGFVRT